MTSLQAAIVMMARGEKEFRNYSRFIKDNRVSDPYACELWGRYERYVSAVRYLMARDARGN